MPVAFLRSPADSMAGVPVKDLLRKRRRGLLLQEDGDQDFGPATGPMRRAGDGEMGGGRNGPQNRDITFGSGSRRVVTALGGTRSGRSIGAHMLGADADRFEATTSRPSPRGQDTQTGSLLTTRAKPPRVAQYQGKTGSVGQEPTGRDENGGMFPAAGVLDKSGQDLPRDTAGSMFPAGDKERVPMTAGEVQSSIHKMVWDAIEYIDEELSPFRANADKYYQGEPFGNEEQGRSQFISTTLRDTVLQIMPSIMRIFWGADRAIEYGPQLADEVDQAQQATEYVWDVVVQQDNHGYAEMYKWFKDALVKRLGIMKYWVDEASETKSMQVSFMSETNLNILYADDEITIERVTPSEGAPPGVMLFDVDYTQVKTEKKIRMVCMPPEEYLFTRGARNVDNDRMYPGVALFVGHRTELTRSQLLEVGVDEDDIEAWAFKDVSLDHNQEEIARQHIVKPDTSAIGPIATQKALYIEGYPYLDVDGDGVAELRRVIMLGPSYHVISNEPWDERPFALLTPDPEPHMIIGQGAVDWTMDLQRLDSQLMRAGLDALSLALNPRYGYIEGNVNLNDILAPEVGAPIRMRDINSLQPLENQGAQAAQAALLYREAVQEIREERTGVTKASAGLDADALQSTEKVAAAAQITAAMQHIEMIARSFAEMGVAPLFRGLLRMLVANPPRQKMVRMRGTYVEMDPRAWNANLPVHVKVAIGAGLQGERYAAIAEQLTKMEGIFNTMGLANPIVTPRQYRDLLVKLAKLRGFVDADAWYQEVDPHWQPPQPQGNDPNMVIAQAEKQKADAEVQKKQADSRRDQEKHQIEGMMKQRDQQLKEQDIMLTDQREREKMRMDFELKREQMQQELRLKERQIELDAQVKRAAQEAKAESDRVAAKSEGDGGGEDGKSKERSFHVKKGVDGSFDIKVK